MQNDCSSKPERQEKHRDILAGIDRIKNARRKLQYLYDEIVGSVQEKCPQKLGAEVIEGSPTLLRVLNETGNVLAEEAELMISIINDIKEKLF